MADMRRRSPEPPPGRPQIQFKPGIANEMLQELAPLLAEEGIDVDDIDVPDLDTLQAAMDRAVERQNLALFTPVGHPRDLAAHHPAPGRSRRSPTATPPPPPPILRQVQPESPDDTVATVAGCIGVALGLLDDWLSGADPHAPDRSRPTSTATGRALER